MRKLLNLGNQMNDDRVLNSMTAVILKLLNNRQGVKKLWKDSDIPKSFIEPITYCTKIFPKSMILGKALVNSSFTVV